MKLAFIPKRTCDQELIISQLQAIHPRTVTDEISLVCDGDILVSSSPPIGDDWTIYFGIIPDKTNALLLDYAGNVDRHFPDGDIFNPDVKAGPGGGGGELDVICPQCNNPNVFSARPNDNDWPISPDGYFMDLTGAVIMINESMLPAHFGRRCQHVSLKGEQCSHRWESKPCPDEECAHQNDIAARYCEKCKTEIINPNDNLTLKTAVVPPKPKPVVIPIKAWRYKQMESKTGNQMIEIIYFDHSGKQIREWALPQKKWIWNGFCRATIGTTVDTVEQWMLFEAKNCPTSITAALDRKGYHQISGYNKAMEVA